MKARPETRSSRPLGLRLPPGWPQAQAPIEWRWVDGAGIEHRGQAGDLRELPGAALQGEVYVWTPPGDTLLTRVNLPTRTHAKILQALPFALEEQVLGEPEDMHYAYRRLSDGELAVAVTARERIEAWRRDLEAAGVSAYTACPLLLALPFEEGAWSLAFCDDELWVRTGAVSGVVLPLIEGDSEAILAGALEEARAEGRAPQRIVIVRAPLDFEPTGWISGLGLPVQVREEPLRIDEAPPLNLLARDRVDTSGAREIALKLRAGIAALALLVLVGLVGSAWEWSSLSRQADAQRAEMLQLFRSAFPETKAIVDPALQMQRNMASLRARSGVAGASDMLPLLGRVAPLLQSNAQIALKGFSYADGKLTLELNLADFQALESLKKALAAEGLRAEVEAANSRDNKVEGRLRIAAGK